MDMIPILKRVPERFAPWKTLCKKVRRLKRALYFSLLSECEQRIREGRRNGSFIEGIIDRQAEFGMTREHVGFVSAFSI